MKTNIIAMFLIERFLLIKVIGHPSGIKTTPKSNPKAFVYITNSLEKSDITSINIDEMLA